MSKLVDYVRTMTNRRVMLVGNTARMDIAQLYDAMKDYRNEIEVWNYTLGYMFMKNGTRVYATGTSMTALRLRDIVVHLDLVLFSPGTRETTKQKFLEKLENKYRTVGRLRRG
jgi:hypothetical protein